MLTFKQSNHIFCTLQIFVLRSLGTYEIYTYCTRKATYNVCILLGSYYKVFDLIPLFPHTLAPLSSISSTAAGASAALASPILEPEHGANREFVHQSFVATGGLAAGGEHLH